MGSEREERAVEEEKGLTWEVWKRGIDVEVEGQRTDQRYDRTVSEVDRRKSRSS